MNNKLTSIIFLFFLCHIYTYAQNISFAYDNSGNRISRTIVLQTRSANCDDKETMYEDMIKERSIKIYPNPTSGLLRIELKGLGYEDPCKITLYSANGNLIQNLESSVDVV